MAPIRIYEAEEPQPIKEALFALCYGDENTGKTTLGLTTRDPLLLDFDGGYLRAGYRGRRVYIDNWNELQSTEFDKALDSCGTVVVDTVDKMARLMAVAIMAANDNNRLGRGKNKTNRLSLQGYGALRDEVAGFHDRLKQTKKHLLYLGHSDSKKRKNGGEEIDLLEVAMKGGGRFELMRDMDLMGLIHRPGDGEHALLGNVGAGGLVLDFDPRGDRRTKNPTKLPPQRLVMGKDYATFMGDLMEHVLKDLNDAGRKIAEEAASRKQADSDLRDGIANGDIAKINELAAKIKVDRTMPDTVKHGHVSAIRERAQVLGAAYDNEKRMYVEVAESPTVHTSASEAEDAHQPDPDPWSPEAILGGLTDED